MLEQRFATEFREAATDEPGLVLEDDGTVRVVKAGGARDSVGGLLSVATKHIASAEVLTLNSQPIVVVPGVTGKVLIPFSVAIVYRFGTVDYVSAHGYAVNWEGFPENVSDPISASGASFPTCDTPSTDGLFVANNAGATAPSGMVSNDLSPFVSLGLILFVYTADPASGDGALDVTTTYQVLSV